MKRLPADQLLAWFAHARRDLPWRQQRTPWRVWVAEIMLQQTTALVASKRFPEFMQRFATPRALAGAEESAALAAWAGLGYYRRVRSLQQAARVVVRDHAGSVPRNEQILRGLPGIGDYTAAAIVALAFNQPAAVIDANVARVMARWLGHESPVNSQAFRSAAREVLLHSVPAAQARNFSEALIELGALLCRAAAADCAACPLARSCVAHSTQSVERFPHPAPRKLSTAVDSLRLLVRRGRRVVMVQRPADAALLPGFWELPGAWLPRGSATDAAMLRTLLAPIGLKAAGEGRVLRQVSHSITTHRLRCRLVEVDARGRLRSAALVDPTAPQRNLTTESAKRLRVGAI